MSHFPRPGLRLDVTWIGVVWVWTSVLWGLAAFAVGASGWLPGAAALLVRALVTLGLGIGLCAAERWAWAPVVCLTAFEALCAGSLAAGSGWLLVTLSPGWPSWKPVALGLAPDLLRQVLIDAGAAALLSGSCALLLWSTRGSFNVPRRRHFTVLRQAGLLPAGVLLLVDAYLLKCWWLAVAR